ncbi:hypothetical protein GCK72_025176 [Caenorhabditis remanei]|uniref:Galectin n=1 Tax=Caenorhabditis remanei TaxID=31234 RepID=A0A6A5G2F4_CAERE|nr:hypothetical protein GCK72_025176 [Caenorhabditis remanei]KAF1748709.1 hypothetical protein GCK72_025176 [Caenorhabditis remanei]
MNLVLVLLILCSSALARPIRMLSENSSLENPSNSTSLYVNAPQPLGMTDDAELEHNRKVHKFFNGRAVHQQIKFELGFRTSKTYVFYLPLTIKSKVEIYINSSSPVMLQIGRCGWTSVIGFKKEEIFELSPDLVQHIIKNRCLQDMDLLYVEVRSIGKTVGEFDIREKNATLFSAFHVLAVGFCVGFLLAFVLYDLHTKCKNEKEKKAGDKKEENENQENSVENLAPVASSESLGDPELPTPSNEPTSGIELKELSNSSSTSSSNSEKVTIDK